MRAAQDIEQITQAIVQKLVVGYQPDRIILFGSHAYGNPDADSDIDLLIVKETSQRVIDRWVTVQRILTGIHRAVPVEPLVLTPVEVKSRLNKGDQLIAKILEKGRVLYDSGRVAVSNDLKRIAEKDLARVRE